MILLTLVGIISSQTIELVPVNTEVRFSISKQPGTSVALAMRHHGPGKSAIRFGGMRDHSPSSTRIWLSGFYPNHKWAMLASDGKPLPLTPKGTRGTNLFGTRDRDDNISVDLYGEMTYRYRTPTLSEAFVLRPGKFKLQITYHELVLGTPLKLSCPAITVVITK
jgi:hypothetical protein